MLAFYCRWMNFVSEVCKPVDYPDFVTNNEIVLETKALRLRRFSSGGSACPTLILPPQAGHHSSICDFSETNSLVRTLINNGVEHLYAVEWKSATEERANESLEELMIYTDLCVSYVGGKVNLIGLCQGGWQGAMYAALFPAKVNSLVLAGSPIDTHADGGKIQDALHMLPLEFFRWMVRMGGGIYRGEYQLLGFKMLNPMDRFFLDFVKLFSRIDDPEYLQKYRNFRNWYEFVNHLPGKWFLQVVDQHFRLNNLIRGRIEIFNKAVNLRNISCPLIMVAGSKDDITLPRQVFNAEKYVSTPPSEITRLLVDSGHIGLFMGTGALKNIWPRVAEKINSYSRQEEYRLAS